MESKHQPISETHILAELLVGIGCLGNCRLLRLSLKEFLSGFEKTLTGFCQASKRLHKAFSAVQGVLGVL